MFPIVIRRIAVIVFVALSLWLSATTLLMGCRVRRVQDDPSNWENRLQAVKQKLPAGTQYVGYIADETLRGQAPTNGELVEFDLTKYALSPVIVHRGVKYPWIIGNFSARNFDGWLKSLIGAYEIQDLGSGIYLIHRNQAKP